MFQRSNEAYERALALDPNLSIAAGQLIANRVERGELGKAYQAAEALVKQRPESAQAHFTLSYVYRYAGMLEQSTRECNAALAIDPGNYTFRSCAWAFMELGETARAKDFVRLDAGSEWAAYVTPSILLREGKIAEAKEAVKQMATAPRYHRDLLEACLLNRPAQISTGLRRKWRPTRRRKPILRFCTTRARCWPTAARSRPPSHYCRAPWNGTIARTRTWCRIRCWRSCVPIPQLTRY